MRYCSLYQHGDLLSNLLCFALSKPDTHLLSDWVRLRDWFTRRSVASELHVMLVTRSSKLRLSVLNIHVRMTRGSFDLGFAALGLHVGLATSSSYLRLVALGLHFDKRNVKRESYSGAGYKIDL